MAIVQAAEVRGLALFPGCGIRSPTGRVRSAPWPTVGWCSATAPFFTSTASRPAGLSEAAEDLRGDGATAIPAGVDGKLAGTLAIADPVKAPTPAALAALRREGVPVVMFTGDN